MTDDVAVHVVGSGPNGLVAAALLARAGVRTVVHEAAATVGGGTRSLELTLPGFVHDVCSAIHPLGVASPALRHLQLERHGLEWVHPDAPAAHPLDDGTAVVLERSVDATAERLGADAAAYRRLFAPLVAAWDEVLAEMLAPPLHVPRHPRALLRFSWRARSSAAGIAARWFRAEPARALLAGMAAHAVSPLDHLASGAIALLLQASGHAAGWPMPRGGAQRIADALAGELAGHGGELRTVSEVADLEELLHREPAHAVLFDVGPSQLLRLAGHRFPHGYRRRLQRWRHGPGAFKVDWALDGPIPWRAPACARAGTVHLGGTFAEIAAAEREVWEGRLPERPFVLLAQQTPFDPTRAPPGKHTAWAYCHVPNGSRVEMTARIEAQVERFAPGFASRVLARHVMAPADLEARNKNLVGGDFSGGAMTLRQVLVRPRLSFVPYATPDPRIWLCSASTPPGGGVHGMCGWHAARALLRKLPR